MIILSLLFSALGFIALAESPEGALGLGVMSLLCVAAHIHMRAKKC
jgi:hypothetical protein